LVGNIFSIKFVYIINSWIAGQARNDKKIWIPAGVYPPLAGGNDKTLVARLGKIVFIAPYCNLRLLRQDKLFYEVRTV